MHYYGLQDKRLQRLTAINNIAVSKVHCRMHCDEDPVICRIAKCTTGCGYYGCLVHESVKLNWVNCMNCFKFYCCHGCKDKLWTCSHAYCWECVGKLQIWTNKCRICKEVTCSDCFTNWLCNGDKCTNLYWYFICCDPQTGAVIHRKLCEGCFNKENWNHVFD